MKEKFNQIIKIKRRIEEIKLNQAKVIILFIKLKKNYQIFLKVNRIYCFQLQDGWQYQNKKWGYFSS